MALNKRQQDVLGFQEYLRLGYPDTPLALNNTIRAQGIIADREMAEQDALGEAANQASARAAEVEFDRDTRIGPVVKPRSNTLRGYKWVLRQKDGVRNVEFSSADYSAFDGIVAERTGLSETGAYLSPAFNQNHPHYEDFAPLRRNIAILRNYLLCQLFEDGTYIPNPKTAEGREDIQHYKMLNQMADSLGAALSSASGEPPSLVARWGKTMSHLVKGEELSTPFANPFMEAANVPDKGIMVMYNYLQGLQETPAFRNFYSKGAPKNGLLPPREQSPFSDENMRLYSRSSMMVGAADAYENDVMKQLRAPENLRVEDRITSVEIAKDILERLRNLMANPEAQARQSQFTDEDHDKTRKLLEVAVGFKDALAVIHDAEPDAIQNNKIIARSFDALEKLGYRMKIEAHKMLVEEYEPSAAKHVQKAIEETPKHYRSETTSTDELLSHVNDGLKEAARIQSQARIAQKIAERAARRAVMNSQNSARAAAKAMNTMRMGKDTYSKAFIRQASTQAVASSVQQAQDQAHAAKAKDSGDAPFLTDPNRGR